MPIDPLLLAAALARVPNQVQQAGLGDRNAWNNCVPTAIMVCRSLYGLPVVDPQRETDGVYGRAFIGGEAFWQAEAWVEANVGPAPGPVAGAADLIDMAIELVRGFAVIGFFHCDVDATINAEGPYLHASVALDRKPDDWHVLNVHDYSEHHYTDAEMTAFTQGAGGFVYYATPLPAQGEDMTPDEHQMLQETHDKVNQMWADYVAGPRSSGHLPDELQGLDLTPVLAALHGIPAAAPVDLAPVLTAIKALPAAPSLQPVLDAIAQVKGQIAALPTAQAPAGAVTKDDLSSALISVARAVRGTQN